MSRKRSLLQLFTVVALTALSLACSSTSRSLQPPRVEVVGVTALPGGASNQRFRVSLLVTNPNTEPVPIEKLRFSVRLAGEGLLTGDSSGFTLPPQGQETLRVDVDGSLISSLSRLLALVQGPANTLPYEIVGDLTLDRRMQNSMPFNSTGEVPLATSAER